MVGVFLQHIPIWTQNSATPTILGQITHKPSLPPLRVGFLLFCMGWWEMTTYPGEHWSLQPLQKIFKPSYFLILCLVNLILIKLHQVTTMVKKVFGQFITFLAEPVRRHQTTQEVSVNWIFRAHRSYMQFRFVLRLHSAVVRDWSQSHSCISESVCFSSLLCPKLDVVSL